VKYVINGVLLISSDVKDIPAHHFAAFSRIHALTLHETAAADLVIQNWNRLAFYGVEIDKIVLRETTLASIDLSIFAKKAFSSRAQQLVVVLDDNSFLKKVTASEWHKFPENAFISIRNTALQTIDITVDYLLDQRSSVTIDMRDNVHIQCKGLAWLAKYVLCSDRVKIEGTTCADKNGQLLSQYLKNSVPNQCRSKRYRRQANVLITTTTTSTTSTTTRTTTTTTTPRTTTTTTTSKPLTTATTATTTTPRGYTTTTPRKGASQASAQIFLTISTVAAVIFFGRTGF
jgi:hypothetical protein